MPRINLSIALSFILAITLTSAYSQCPHPNATLSFGTQNKVNDWLEDYPDCKVVDKDIWIGFPAGPVGPGGNGGISPITNLNGFKNIEEINGTLTIAGPLGYWQDISYDIVLLTGMKSLKKVETLVIDDIPNFELIIFDSLEVINKLVLKDLPSFKELRSFVEDLTIVDTLILDDVTQFDLSKFNFPSSMKLIQVTGGDWNEELIPLFDEISAVDHLQLRNTQIKSLDSDVDVNKNLQLLGNSALEDISGLHFPEEMEAITLISNKPFYQGLENFQNVLRISHELSLIDVHDISSFSQLKHIERLVLSGNEDVTDFSTFTDLESIGSISASNLPELSDMSTFANVQFLGPQINLGSVGVQNLNDLKITNFETLYSVSLSNCENLSDLSFLRGATKFQDIQLSGCPSLTSLNGLQEANNIDVYLGLIGLENLSSLDELSNLEFANSLNISSLNISDLSGLEGLRIIKEDFTINRNPNLENFDALVGLLTIGIDEQYNRFKITENSSLQSIEGLHQTKGLIDGQLEISNNPLLNECSIDYVCSNISYGEASIRIENNSTDCNSEEAVIDRCGFNYLEVFLDDNANGIQDINEPNVEVGQINVGDNYIYFPNNQGRVGFFLDENPGYIEYVAEEFWDITTNNAYTPTQDLLLVPDLIKIGIKGNSNFINAVPYLSFSNVVCSREYNIKAVVKNEGTEPVNATMSFTAPGKYIPTLPFPTDTTDNIITFEFGEILPGQIAEGMVRYQAPSVEDVDLNSVLALNYNTEIIDNLGTITEDEGSYELIFLCAYDPNDKQVFPSGVQDQNYTLFEDDEFEYLIRFQNTGNFPAQDIVIRDTLDPNLDPSTFEFITASHEVSRILLDGHALAFDFKNIFLPDSLNNEPESHGFVHFKINTKVNLAENTLIENTANIYFDFNPAIVTNTAYNTMVSVIPTSGISDITKPHFTLFPNPASDQVIIRQDQALKLIKYQLLDTQGKVLISSSSQSKDTTLDVNHLSPGIYLMKVNEQVQKIIIH